MINTLLPHVETRWSSKYCQLDSATPAKQSGTAAGRARRTIVGCRHVGTKRTEPHALILMLLKIKQRSKKEPPHSRDWTPCGELAIPYIDLIWSCARRKTPKT